MNIQKGQHIVVFHTLLDTLIYQLSPSTTSVPHPWKLQITTDKALLQGKTSRKQLLMTPKLQPSTLPFNYLFDFIVKHIKLKEVNRFFAYPVVL